MPFKVFPQQRMTSHQGRAADVCLSGQWVLLCSYGPSKFSEYFSFGKKVAIFAENGDLFLKKKIKALESKMPVDSKILFIFSPSFVCASD